LSLFALAYLAYVLGLGHLVDLIVLVYLNELAESIALAVAPTVGRGVCATIDVATLPALVLETKHVFDLQNLGLHGFLIKCDLLGVGFTRL
jgi:hypothetical protein